MRLYPILRQVQLITGILVAGGLLAAGCSHAEKIKTITNKTLVVWVSLADLDQRGGSALTLDDLHSRFDAIVFGEIAPGKWMSGSDGWHRTPQDQSGFPEETAEAGTLVQLAIVYEGESVRLFRDGQAYTAYDIDAPLAFGPESVVVMGLRHLDAGDRACLSGAIEDARIYDRPLTQAQIAGLQPHEASSPEPLAWWSFREGQATDRMGRFPETLLKGNARIDNGRLVLDGRESYLVAMPREASDRVLAKADQGDDLSAASRAHRARLLADAQRPRYHFVAPEGSCMPFDPNGAIFWQGKYHLCYIFQDERGHCWGHASSTDLVHWRFHPPALYPSPGDVDKGIFSGNCFVNLNGEATMLYHGVDAGNCIATCAEKELENWTKLPSNPIIPNVKEGSPEFGKYASWDPHGWAEGDRYYAIFGGNPGSGTPATLFRGIDLASWEYVGPFLDHDMPGVQPDDDISCPDFFQIGDTHMLLCISHKRGCRYYLGRWENERFYPESHAWMNFPGGTFFAPESLLDDQGRRIMWAWVLDWRPGQEPPPAGWSGVMSLPRHLWLGEDDTLRMAPVKELESLRWNHRAVSGVALEDGQNASFEGIAGDTLELALEVNPGTAKEVGLGVRRSPGGEEETRIVYNPSEQSLRIELAKSSAGGYLQHLEHIMGGPNNPVTEQKAPFVLPEGEPLRLRVFLDRSILEVYANERQALVQRIDPVREDSTGISLFATGGQASLIRLDAWDMAPTNPW